MTIKEPEYITKRNLLYPGYPQHAPFKSHPSENLYWYYNEEKNFGCWVLNQYKKPMFLPPSQEEVVKSKEHKLKYRSPLPLHEVKVPNCFRAHMTWYVDKEGFGQYVYYTRTRQDDGTFLGEFLFMTVLPDKYRTK